MAVLIVYTVFLVSNVNTATAETIKPGPVRTTVNIQPSGFDDGKRRRASTGKRKSATIYDILRGPVGRSEEFPFFRETNTGQNTALGSPLSR